MLGVIHLVQNSNFDDNLSRTFFIAHLAVFGGIINFSGAREWEKGEKLGKKTAEFSFMSVICSWSAKRKMTY